MVRGLDFEVLGQELAEDEAPEDGGTAKYDRRAKQRSRRRKEYEFTRWEERIMEVVMEAMRMAGLALGLQALSSVALGAPSILFIHYLSTRRHTLTALTLEDAPWRSCAWPGSRSACTRCLCLLGGPCILSYFLIRRPAATDLTHDDASRRWSRRPNPANPVPYPYSLSRWVRCGVS